MRVLLFVFNLMYWISLLSGVSMSLETHLVGGVFTLALIWAHSREDEDGGSAGGFVTLIAFGISALVTYWIIPGADK